MKKIITIALLSFLLTVSAVISAAAAQTEHKYEEAESSSYCSVCADTDGDGAVTVGDARKILRAAVGIDEIEDDDIGAYDVNADGKIGVDDARDALRIAVGLESRATHSKGEVLTLTEATCARNGKGAFLCAHCGKIYEYTVLPNPGHVAGARKTVRKATCTQTGEYEYRCKFCDKLMDTVTVPTVPHEWEGVTESCLKKINSTLTCKNCGATKEIVIEPVGHHNFRSVTVKKATCTEDGERIKVCTVCGVKSDEEPEKIPNLGGHRKSGWRIMSTVSCKTEGRQIKVCTRCGELLDEEITPKKEHVRTEGTYVLDEPATCEHEGKAHYTCSTCRDLVWVTIPKLDHTPIGSEEIMAATCSKEGYRKGTCAECGHGYTTVIPKTPHTKATDWTVTEHATCVSAGKKVLYCVLCSAILEEKEIPVDKQGHMYHLAATVEPTCTSAGKYIYVCDYCDKENTVPFGEAKGHTPGEEVLIEEVPDKGFNVCRRRCAECGELYGAEYLSPREN